jgi:hypothetical protein
MLGLRPSDSAWGSGGILCERLAEAGIDAADKLLPVIRQQRLRLLRFWRLFACVHCGYGRLKRVLRPLALPPGRTPNA